jgi:hypothetical protein
MFTILDESHSFLLDKNLAKYLPKVAASPKASAALLEDPGFVEANLKHAINGYLYCNLPGLEFAQGRPTRVYFMALGGSGDMHTPNSAEGALYLDGQRKQSVRLLPGAMLTTDISCVLVFVFVGGGGCCAKQDTNLFNNSTRSLTST